MPKTMTKSVTSDVHLASTLRISLMRLARRVRAERTDETLTLTQLSALSSIAHKGPLSPSTLAEIERVQPPSMTRVIAVLEARGLVARTVHPTDRRVSVIETTATGRRLLANDRRRREAWLARMLEDLSPEEREILRQASPILDKLGGS
jgi:DNA-binding MarR family transcriptional regulator